MTNHYHGFFQTLHAADMIDQVVGGYCRDPFAFLGMHAVGDGSLVVRAFLPGASYLEVLHRETKEFVAEMTLIHEWGLFAVRIIDRGGYFPYCFRVDFGSGMVEMEDPYRFPPIWNEVDSHLFLEGTHGLIHERLGAHPLTVDGVLGTYFAVWAPNAQRVSVIGPFNNWDGRRNSLRLRIECGVWEIFIPLARAGDMYKFELKGPGGEGLLYKADPYAFFAEPPPGNASIIQAPSHYVWQDAAWLAARALKNDYHAPMSIYEMHLGSWKKKTAAENQNLSYRELASELIPYLTDMGFTHVEFLPVAEFSSEESWGYQPTGLFAPTSRWGSPDDLRYLIDQLHQAGIGVFMDWVPSHFPADEHGLGRFDGTATYEHEDPRRGFHPDRRSLVYNYGQREVANFLISNALYWIKQFHIDGLRVNSVTSMLYNDYSRQEGEWTTNQYGGNENIEAIEFLRMLNTQVYAQGAGAITIAEESSVWPMVSKPVEGGGLGFGYKWNTGWLSDTLSYMRTDPSQRPDHHNRLTFGMLYGFQENFILPLSHGEVIPGRGSLLAQMPGDTWRKFANLRVYYTFMFCYPGKKMLFMGDEFAQEQEWSHHGSLAWHLLDPGHDQATVHYHRGVAQLVKNLNRLYVSLPSLHELDHEAGGFEWIDCDDHQQSVISWIRRGKVSEDVVVICNFTPTVRENYRLGVNKPGAYKEVLNSDADMFGGANVGNSGLVVSAAIPAHGREHSLALTLPPLGALIFRQQLGEHDAKAINPQGEPQIAGKLQKNLRAGDDTSVAATRATPAVPIAEAVTAEVVICLICGKPLKSLQLHLARSHNMEPAEYRNVFGLPRNFPMTPKPNYSLGKTSLHKKNK